MGSELVGYARVSTRDQDLTAQHHALQALGVPEARIYVDHELTVDQQGAGGSGIAHPLQRAPSGHARQSG